ncbi:hypothetical protein HWV62_43858 [Athelia sp. TMB]|nr:hypothetical protein HWV62_43858 [Athelia sp. TMB]
MCAPRPVVSSCNILGITCSFGSSEPTSSIQAARVTSTLSPAPHSRSHGSPRGAGTELSQNESPRSRTHILPPHVKKVGYIEIEDIFPLPPSAPWGLAKVPGGFDWTATPMLAMQNITTGRIHACDDAGIEPRVHGQLMNILGPNNLQSLLQISFEVRYSPWLNLQPDTSGTSTLLALAQCVVASRHLEPCVRDAVVPPLQKLAEDAIFRYMFTAVPPMHAIHAIMILSLWSPVGAQVQGSMRDVRDGRLLAASAVSMAMNLKLSQAIEYVASLKEDLKKGESMSVDAATDLEDGVERARMWLSLMNVEWMLCIGTGRSPLSHRTAADSAAIDWSFASNLGAGRDMRIALAGQLIEATEAGLRLHCTCKRDFGTFFQAVQDVGVKLDDVLRLISPLSVVAEHEVFYFHMLLVYHHACRLLIMHHSMREARRVYTEPSGPPWFEIAKHCGVNIAMKWGQEAVIAAETTLSTMLSRPESDVELMATTPDNIFAMLCFAASFLIMCKISIHQIHGGDLPESSNTLLAKTNALFARLACAPDHAPSKCAQLIIGLVAGFEARTGKRMVGFANGSGPPIVTRPSGGLAAAISQGDRHPCDLPIPGDLSELLNSELMLDADFWASFMDNLTTDVVPP